jgi:beta-glucosidase
LKQAIFISLLIQSNQLIKNNHQMKNLFLRLSMVAMCVFLAQCSEKIPVYKDARAPLEKRVDDLLSRMTLDEKLAQLNHYSDTSEMSNGAGFLGSLNNDLLAREAAIQCNEIQRFLVHKTRLGIPAFKSGESIFTYLGNGATSFPQSIAMAATWDTSCMRVMADALSEEVKSRGVREVFAPVVNIARDSRWGRTGETYGEDPFLTSAFGVAYCKVFEGKGILAMSKHFAANMGLDGKFASPVHFSERLMREVYFPAFKACFQQGGSKAVMMAYNTFDGVPCTMNKWLMTDIIKKEWGFDGIVASDGGGIDIAEQAFGLDTSRSNLVARAINAGCDYALSGPEYYFVAMKKAIKEGKVKESTINEAVRRVLRQKFATGLFDSPYADPEYAEKINNCKEHRQLALELSKKSIVLLKNDHDILPFRKDLKRVLVCGPLADKLLINHYGGYGRKEVSVLEGVKNTLPGTEVVFERGAGIGFTFLPAIEAKYFYHSENAVIKPGLKAEYFKNFDCSGNPDVVRTDANIDFDWGLDAPIPGFDKDKFSVRWTGKFKAPVSGRVMFNAHGDDKLSVYIDGKLVIDMTKGPSNSFFVQDGNIILEKGKEYDIRAEFTEKGGKAFAQLGWDVDRFRFIPSALKEAEKSDAIIAVVGMRDDENGDRTTLDLDDAQEKLICDLAATGKPLVVVIQTGTVITMYNWIDKVSAVLQAWYPGCEGGNAIAQTIFGDNNPAGRLPLTFPKVTGQVPLNYNHLPWKPDDNYVGIGNDPLFAFGHGLSYTRFGYSNMKLSKTHIKSNESVVVSIDIKNTGKRDGDEVVQLYIHDVLASVARPVMELRGFKRISLKAGQTQTVSFTLTPENLQMLNEKMKYVVEPGDFKIMVGAASDDIRASSILQVVE